MRIAVFTESLPPNTDGVSRTYSYLAETLREKGMDFRFYSPFKPETGYFWKNRVRKIWSFPFPLYKKYKISLPLFDNPEQELDRFRPDIIHVSSPTPLGYFGLRYARRHFIPAAATYHTHFVSYFPYYGLQAMEPMGWSILRHFHNSFLINLAPSESARLEIQTQGIKNVELWERGVDLRLFSPRFFSRDTRRIMGSADRQKLLFVGRLVKEKNIDDLLDAAKLLRAKGYPFDLAFIGDGPMKEEIRQREPGAYLPGYLHGQELAAVYASSDIFVFPSTTETFGNVLQEAWASGLPVVGVRAGGSQDLIQHGLNGLICEPKNPTEFAANIEILLQNQGLRRKMSENALNLIQDRTWTAINGRLLNRYETLIRDFRAGRVAYKETFRDWLAGQIAYPGDWMHAA